MLCLYSQSGHCVLNAHWDVWFWPLCNIVYGLLFSRFSGSLLSLLSFSSTGLLLEVILQTVITYCLKGHWHFTCYFLEIFIWFVPSWGIVILRQSYGSKIWKFSSEWTANIIHLLCMVPKFQRCTINMVIVSSHVGLDYLEMC